MLAGLLVWEPLDAIFCKVGKPEPHLHSYVNNEYQKWPIALTFFIPQVRGFLFVSLSYYYLTIDISVALTASEPDPTSTLVVTAIRSPGTTNSIQEGPRPSHTTNGATASLLNGSSRISRSSSTSIHRQAQQEEKSEFHRETTPLLLPWSKRWRSGVWILF